MQSSPTAKAIVFVNAEGFFVHVDVITGGSSEDRQAARIEAALTQRDEFGRVMPPKERWRELNYKYVR